jgi:DeoR/GlpR family transcriptional regulator of sugar metabolism
LEEAEVKQALADASTQVVVAVDRTKLGRHGPARSLPMTRIDLLVTDLDPGDAQLDPYRELVELR